MRWVRYTADGRTSYGSLSGGTINEISGEPWDTYSATGRTHRLSDVKLNVPVVPRTFYAAGINYAAHIREMAEKRGVQPVFPEKADLGLRLDPLAHCNGVTVQMPVQRGDSVPVVYLNDLAVRTSIAGVGHGPRRRGIDRRHKGSRSPARCELRPCD